MAAPANQAMTADTVGHRCATPRQVRRVNSLAASAIAEPKANRVNRLPTVRTPYRYTARTMPKARTALVILRNANAMATSAYGS